ncbi:hypothetical protein QJ731_02705 [Staphylococcus hominis]|uniref:hypothetical protein n=1 Tax=Staphylococcus hominis TaxID=1290 RepID=UPI0034CFD8B6
MYLNKIKEILNDISVQSITLTLINGDEFTLRLRDIKESSEAELLVLNESENLIINLNYVIKITKNFYEEFVMHNVDF